MQQRIIRKPPIIWLTGNSGAGKSTLAFTTADKLRELQQEQRVPHSSVVVLDGDEMRATISTDEGFSYKDRKKHNLRVARLAKLLQQQGILVIVAVIAPYQRVRNEITKICDPRWVYIARSGIDAPDRPYEAPLTYDLLINTEQLTKEEAQIMLLEYIQQQYLPAPA